MKNKKRKRLSWFMLFITLAVVVITGVTLVWQSISQRTKSELQTSDPTYAVELVKLEKLPDGTLTDTLIPGARFYLFSEAGSQMGQMYETDGTGKIAVELPAGKYYFEEVYPGNDFDFDKENEKPKTKYPFEVKKADTNGITTVKAYNVPVVGNLTVEKTVKNADGSPPTATQKDTLFEFKVNFSNNGAYLCSIDGGKPQNIKSGSYIYLKHDQKAVFSNVPEGVTYSVTETPKEEYITQSIGHHGTMVKEGRTASFINTHINITSGLVVTKTVQGDGSDIDKTFEFTAVINGETTNFTLKHGESKAFSDLPLGTEYTVTEKDYTKHGYVSTVKQYDGVIQGEDAVVLPFVNIYEPIGKTGSLVVTKKVFGGEPDPNKTFTFQVEFIGDDTLQSPQTFTLKAGEQKEFKNLPAGVQYIVKETDANGYLPIVKQISGTIPANTAANADFVNQKFSEENGGNDGFGSIVVTKQVKGDGFDPEKEFEFTADLNGKIIPFKLKNGESKVFPKVSVDTEYTITEKDYSNENYETPIPVQKGIVAGKEKIEIVFENIFNPSKLPGELVVGKKVVGENPDPSKTFAFEITFTGDNTLQSPQTFTLKAGEQKVFEKLPAGVSYTIKETDSGGYICTTDTINGKIVGEHSTVVGFINQVNNEKPPAPIEHGTLIVTKQVQGKEADKNKTFEFFITIDGKVSSFVLKDGERKEFPNLPIGASYTVTEKDYTKDDYMAAIKTYTGTITNTESVVLPFKNVYKPSALPGGLLVEKKVVGENPDLDKEFKFKVEFSGSNAPESPQFFTLKADQTKLFEKLPSGVRFVVTEIDSAGYLPANEQVNGTVIGEQTTNVTFINQVTKAPDPPIPPEKAGSIVVTKQVAGNGADLDKPFEFTAMIDGKTVKFTLKHGESKEFTELPLGAMYSITEKDYSDEGYVTPTPSY